MLQGDAPIIKAKYSQDIPRLADYLFVAAKPFRVLAKRAANEKVQERRSVINQLCVATIVPLGTA